MYVSCVKLGNEDCYFGKTVRSSIRNPSSLEQEFDWDMTFRSGGRMPFIEISVKYWWSLTLCSSRRLKQPQTSSQTFPTTTVLMWPSDPGWGRAKGSSGILGVPLTALRDRLPAPNPGCKPALVTLTSFTDISSAFFLSWWVTHCLHTYPGCSIWTQSILSPRHGRCGGCATPDTSCAHRQAEPWMWHSRYSLTHSYSFL